MDVALIRKRLKTEIDQARRTAAERRERSKTATRAYATFLEEIAVPTFRQVANILRAEGIPFEVQTPLDGVRLVSDRSRDDVIALELDATQDPPQVMLSSMRTLGQPGAADGAGGPGANRDRAHHPGRCARPPARRATAVAGVGGLQARRSTSDVSTFSRLSATSNV